MNSENIFKNDRSNNRRLKISGLVFAAFLTATAVSAQTAPSSALRLIGTIEGGSLRGAVLQDSTGKQTFYGLYDTLPDGSKIVKLRDDSISLKSQDGTLYDMYISHDTKTASTGAPTANAAAPFRGPVPDVRAETPPQPAVTPEPAQTPRTRGRQRHIRHDDEEN